ncbi:hypothetical protein [Halomicrobium urmianum]|uniref:hypothetical protein n=1 Tax=Halomicrobium urmianum TaxID=1586233 RepID=UPI001CDA48FF|nr:hypothetical protein [Halomicrobium urmianum]
METVLYGLSLPPIDERRRQRDGCEAERGEASGRASGSDLGNASGETASGAARATVDGGPAPDGR